MPSAPPDPLVALLTERLQDAQDRMAKRAGWTGRAMSARLSADMVAEVAAALVPVIRQAALDAAVQVAPPRPIHVRYAAPDLPSGAGERPDGAPAGVASSGDGGPGPWTAETDGLETGPSRDTGARP